MVLPSERFGLQLRNKEVNESSSLLVFDSATGELNDFVEFRVFKFATGGSAISSSLNLVKTLPGQLEPGQLLSMKELYLLMFQAVPEKFYLVV